MAVKLVESTGSGAAPTLRDIDASGNEFVYTTSLLSFSGNYALGGDTLDLTPLANIVPSSAMPIDAFADGNGIGTTQQASGGYYAVLLGSTLAGVKIKVFSGGGVELAAGAYPAAVTGDSVSFIATWRKFQ